VPAIKDVGMTEKPAEDLVLVDQVMQTVKVTVQPLYHHAHHRYLLQRHTRTAGAMADMVKKVLLKEGKQAGSQTPFTINLLQADQEMRHVIATPVIEVNAGNVNVTEFGMELDDLSHGAKPAKIHEKWRKKGTETGKCQ